MNRSLSILVIILLASFEIKAQFRFGLGLEYGWNKLTNVDPNELSPYGHSGKQSNQRSNNTISPLIYIEKDVVKYWSVELGLGYIHNKHSFDFKYFHQMYGWPVNATVTFSTKYFLLPISINYTMPINSSSDIKVGLGIKGKFRLKGEDNYNTTIFEAIEIVAPHNSLIIAPEFKLGYQRNLGKRTGIYAGAYISYDTGPITKGKWGFLKNVSQSRLLQSGFAIKLHFLL